MDCNREELKSVILSGGLSVNSAKDLRSFGTSCLRMTWLVLALYISLNEPFAFAADKIRIVATTKTFADLAEKIGGEFVRVDYVAPPSQNAHFIQPRPSDVRRLSKADVFVHAGLDLELWRGPLVEASGKTAFLPGGGREIDLSKGIRLLEIPQTMPSRSQGDIHLYGNPHYWLNPENGRIMAETLYEKLAEFYPEHQGEFKQNLDQFLKTLENKIREWKESGASLRGQSFVAYHQSWPYLAEFLEIEIVGFVEPKPGIPPTGKHLGELIRTMKEKKVKAIVKEPYFENRAPKKLAKETGAKILTLAQSVGETKEASDYFQMFDYNVKKLVEALTPNSANIGRIEG